MTSTWLKFDAGDRTKAVLAVAIVAALIAGDSAGARSGAMGPRERGRADRGVGAPGVIEVRSLHGAIDIHVHSDPDNVPRSLDGLDAAKQALARGMRLSLIHI